MRLERQAEGRSSLKRRLIQAVRVTCAAYWTVLTVLLLVPDPAALLGIDRPSGDVKVYGVHFAFFLGLAVLAAASRWPLGRRGMAAVLAGYALLAEALQWWVPNRTVELVDLAENLLGLAAGAAVWWAIGRVRRAARERKP
jgi:VanZ family protein